MFSISTGQRGRLEVVMNIEEIQKLAKNKDANIEWGATITEYLPKIPSYETSRGNHYYREESTTYMVIVDSENHWHVPANESCEEQGSQPDFRRDGISVANFLIEKDIAVSEVVAILVETSDISTVNDRDHEDKTLYVFSSIPDDQVRRIRRRTEDFLRKTSTDVILSVAGSLGIDLK